MKKIILFLLAICVSASALAESFILDNQTSLPAKNQQGKISIQWASSADEVRKHNQNVMEGTALNSKSLQAITKTGLITLTIPKNVTYFRVVAWKKSTKQPDLLTNWINIAPNTTYTLDQGHLIPVALIAGMGC